MMIGGSPFNGQKGRRELCESLLSVCEFQAIVETGTFLGDTTACLAQLVRIPIVSIESRSDLAHHAALRLAIFPHVRCIQGDSPHVLRQLLAEATLPSSHVFWYLDAHGAGRLPLWEELRIIQANWYDSVIMIDDFAIPFDRGYGFDDYGDEGSLSLAYLTPHLISDAAIFYPSLPSYCETGHRRGCAVITLGKTMTWHVKEVDALVEYSWS